MEKTKVAIAALLIIFLFGGIKMVESDKDTELKERIGQMMMVGFRGTKISKNSPIIKIIRDTKLGGVILYDRENSIRGLRWNIINPRQTKKLISDLQRYSPIPLFIAIDAEGGMVSRLNPKRGFPSFLSHEDLGKINDYKFTKQEALKISQELKNLGFNMNFVPVVDVNINSKNPIIAALGRSFSSDPRKVALHAQAFIEAHRQNNIITVAKHFPGHGSSKGDSHQGRVDVTDVYKDEELIPYKLLQEQKLLDAVMTAHIFNKNIDKDYPATLSPVFIQKILRGQIGFDGVIISDDMEMKAISDYYSIKDAIIKAINAGCDIILFSNNSLRYDPGLPYKIQKIICQAVKDGRISRQRIIESSNRIYELKKQFKIIPQ